MAVGTDTGLTMCADLRLTRIVRAEVLVSLRSAQTALHGKFRSSSNRLQSCPLPRRRHISCSYLT